MPEDYVYIASQRTKDIWQGRARAPKHWACLASGFKLYITRSDDFTLNMLVHEIFYNQVLQK